MINFENSTKATTAPRVAFSRSPIGETLPLVGWAHLWNPQMRKAIKNSVMSPQMKILRKFTTPNKTLLRAKSFRKLLSFRVSSRWGLSRSLRAGSIPRVDRCLLRRCWHGSWSSERATRRWATKRRGRRKRNELFKSPISRLRIEDSLSLSLYSIKSGTRWCKSQTRWALKRS